MWNVNFQYANYFPNFPDSCLFYDIYQPPWDTEIGNKFIIHYTYGCDYDLKVIYCTEISII